MTNKQVYSLCEAVADIAYIASAENYYSGNSRETIEQIIGWAEEFERTHKHVNWGVDFEPDYIDSIYLFAIFKINQWRNI